MIDSTTVYAQPEPHLAPEKTGPDGPADHALGLSSGDLTTKSTAPRRQRDTVALPPLLPPSQRHQLSLLDEVSI